IGRALQAPHQGHQLGSCMVAKHRLILSPHRGHIGAQASGILAIWLETWVGEQVVESQGATERWPLALFAWPTARELPEGKHNGTVLRLPALIRWVVGAPAVVALPGVRIILRRNLNRLESVQGSQLRHRHALPVSMVLAVEQRR